MPNSLGWLLPTQSLSVVWGAPQQLARKTSWEKRTSRQLKIWLATYRKNIRLCSELKGEIQKGLYPKDQKAPNSPDTMPRVLSPSSYPVSLQRGANTVCLSSPPNISGPTCVRESKTRGATYNAHVMITGNVGIAVMTREKPMKASMRIINQSWL